MMTPKRYSDRMAATLKEWSAQIADLQAKARSAGGEQQAQIGRQVAALQQQRTEYAEQMRKTRDTSEAVFRDMRQGAERMAAEFRKTYVQAASRFAH
jgi:conjugal transfer/entry exclusion protein